MKKPIIISVLFLILTAISSFGQGVWIEENFNRWGQKTGKIEVNGNVYEINSEADLSDANLSGANLSNTYLLRINFTKANLSGANLSGAVLNQVTFNETDLSKTNFSDAEIGFTRFKGMIIEETNFSGAVFFAATIDNCTFKNVNLLWAESFDFMKSEKKFTYDRELHDLCPNEVSLWGFFQSEKYFKDIEQSIR